MIISHAVLVDLLKDVLPPNAVDALADRVAETLSSVVEAPRVREAVISFGRKHWHVSFSKLFAGLVSVIKVMPELSHHPFPAGFAMLAGLYAITGVSRKLDTDEAALCQILGHLGLHTLEWTTLRDEFVKISHRIESAQQSDQRIVLAIERLQGLGCGVKNIVDDSGDRFVTLDDTLLIAA